METDYIRVPLKGILVDSVPNFDLYIKRYDRFVLFRKANYKFGGDSLKHLIENRIEVLYIDRIDLNLYAQYRQKIMEGCPDRDGVLGFEGIFVDPEAVNKYYQIVGNFFSVERAFFERRIEIGFPLFFHQGNEIYPLPAFATQEKEPWVVAPEDIPAGCELMIRKVDVDSYLALIRHWLAESGETELPAARKAVILRESSKLQVQRLLDSPENTEIMEQLRSQILEVVDFALQNEDSFCELMRIQAHDFYTYVHSINVCTLCVGLGASLGLLRSPDLELLALGGVLHDVGKVKLDPRLINKPGKLSLDEFVKLKNHVKFGVDLLREHHQLPQEVLDCVALHHERLSGNGYPLGLKNAQIPLFGRITSIVDSYDSLISERPYKPPVTPYDALALLRKTQADYDQDLLSRFILMLGEQLDFVPN